MVHCGAGNSLVAAVKHQTKRLSLLQRSFNPSTSVVDAAIPNALLMKLLVQFQNQTCSRNEFPFAFINFSIRKHKM